MTRCPKTKYLTRTSAESGLVCQNEATKRIGRKSRLRGVYLCRIAGCGFWHVTKQVQRLPGVAR